MRHRLFLSSLLLLAAGLLLVVAATMLDSSHQQRLSDNRKIVRELLLTDLSFSTEARYTRHPSQADLFSAFQDGPGLMEHFPSGSWGPPPHLLQGFADQAGEP